MSGYDAAGGAWIATSYGGSTTIENSTISGNSTVAPVGTYTTNLPGGGLFIQNRSGTTTILNSTISGNQAEESGGGIKIYEGGGGELRILHSTITNNRANSNGDGVGVGGGIDVGNSQTVVTLDHTIVAGNYHGGEMASTRDDINVGQFFGGSLTVTWSLIGDNAGSGLAGAPVGSPDVNGNLIGTSAVPIDPKLAPLAFNGGPTRTHALLPGSPAIDAGDPNFDPNSFTPPLLYDQRGESFARVLDGDGNASEIIDIGAFEVGPSDNLAPKVADVLLNGVQTGTTSTDWVNMISFADVVPLGKQLAPIYRDGTNRVEIVFSEDVTVTNPTTTLTLKGTGYPDAPKTITADDYTYDPSTYTATWTFNDLGPDKYRIDLMADGVQDANNPDVILDGHWDNLTNGTPDIFSDDPTFRPFQVGNGMQGSNFQFFFSLLPGDYNQDGVVADSGDASDLLVVNDGTGDGIIDSADYDLATANNGNRLPLLMAAGGDYHDDELVDSGDYAVWKMHFGETVVPYTLADGNGNGLVDSLDYIIWTKGAGTEGAWYIGSHGVGSLLPIVDFGNAPTVANVTISGSNSTHDPYSFATHVGSGEQLVTVPVGGADSISITFSEDVNVSASDLRLVGLTTANVPALAEFSYDMVTMTATWRFENVVANDIYLISLSDAITDIEGNRLDGEWVNPATTTTTNALVSVFPSGDGNAGGTFNFAFTIMAGDANRNNIVDGTDYGILSYNYYIHTLNAQFTQGDFSGDGIADNPDYDIWTAEYLKYNNFTSIEMLGDLNGDFVVNNADMQTLANHVGMSNPTWADGDLNGDGQINTADLDLMFAQYGLGLSVVS